MRFAVYSAAGVFLLWPILLLTIAWTQPPGSGGFILCVAIFPFFLAISRWDIIGYGLQYALLLALLVRLNIFPKIPW